MIKLNLLHLKTKVKNIGVPANVQCVPPAKARPDREFVFDSSAECDGTSLNDVLPSRPDLNNTLLGVLLRFQKEPVALTADAQQMFYCFVVQEDHRDYLQYL